MIFELMIMASISRSEVKQLLERLIFVDDRPQDWVEDVWGMSPTLGETAARLVDAFEAVIECCSEEKLENLLQSLYSDRLDEDI
ncbi:hypothetical protein HFV01_12910 [Limnospira fusiformis SAG 85.79]|uniref:Uncharacterized protein n=3 Tax=Limnospira TaxID=2596745 RepID=A0A9P1P0Y2_9CYAN|nr:hypothetical protein AP285_04585 [Arthrospira platensis YZ]EDZ94223.1 conserved hypothetical protein [Limnospira maxima CS-328]QJB26542.1 hypothetical protein HFV01_12910 [Limnospira fusiformis SAG 85.79]UWU48657.1 hypothetical protein APLC1_3457 [Arthrospira platensis C1]CDM95320.1 conserved hypothetical protein [Limnospira indica PCC 8005]